MELRPGAEFDPAGHRIGERGPTFDERGFAGGLDDHESLLSTGVPDQQELDERMEAASQLHAADPDAPDHSPAGPTSTDPTGDSGPADHRATVTVTINGEQLAGQETAETDGDGRNDTAPIPTSDGDVIALTDLAGDGSAEHIALLGSGGNVIDTAHVGSDGQWIDDGAGQSLAGSTSNSVTATTTPTHTVDAQTGEWVSG